MKAVDSEHKKNLPNDEWRIQQLLRSETNPLSYFNNFSTGKLETLNKPEIRDKLLDFYKKHYSSHLMGLAIVSNLSIEELEEQTKIFETVPLNDSSSLPNFMENRPYNKDNLNILYKIVPIKNTDKLWFKWYLEDVDGSNYKSEPLKYVSSVLGHEGPNSLLSSLMKDDLASSLSTGYDIYAKSYGIFTMKITLTKKGLSQIEEVTKRVIYKIKQLQNEKISERYFEEVQTMSQARFDYKEKQQPAGYVRMLASRFFNYEPEDILTGTELYDKFDEKLIKKSFQDLNLNNLNMYIISQEYKDECILKEVHYETKFVKDQLPNYVNKYYSEEYNDTQAKFYNFDYPPINNYIPTNFNILSRSEDKSKENNNENKYPTAIFKNESNVIWHKLDETFKLPYAIVGVQIYFNLLELFPYCK